MAILGNVKLVAYGFVPHGWAACDGQLLPIASNTALFSIIGTIYGGDGRTTFGLPDLRTRVPIHQSGSHREGSSGGASAVSLTVGQMPEHTHPLMATEDAVSTDAPAGHVPAGSPRGQALYAPASAGTVTNMEPDSIGHAGGGQAHENMQPGLGLQYVICVNGEYPSRDGALPDEGEDFLADVKTYGFNSAPRGWAACDGQLLPIAQYQSLYSLLGTTYGGDGKTTFALPDLRGRAAVGEGNLQGNQVTLGEKMGAESVTLKTSEIPSHNHQANLVNATGSAVGAEGTMFAANPNFFTSGTLDATLDPSAVGAPNPNGQAHDNMMPFLAVNYCICLQGLFPSRS
jgi:microcystin-dependent protein